MTNLLVIATTPADSPRARAAVENLAARATSIHVVSPASKLSKLQWLTNEEDDARAEGEEVAKSVGDVVEDHADTVDREVGDVDPVQAAEDALRTFPADEIVVLVRPEHEATWLERSAVEDGFERFGVPVRYLVVPNSSNP
jgi:hypothetical protein